MSTPENKNATTPVTPPPADDKKVLALYSREELACITAGVPATGNANLDFIVATGLKYKIAIEVMAALHGSAALYGGADASCRIDHHRTAALAVDAAEALIAEFKARAR